MIFIDTSAWYAIFSRRDINHLAAVQVIRAFREQLITSDYVVSETLTLLRARGENRRAIAFGQRVIEGRWTKVEQVEVPDIMAAWSVFHSFHDKKWSFVDCTS